jgi:protocatechuate 3,4-dioxygenase, beta subunit
MRLATAVLLVALGALTLGPASARSVKDAPRDVPVGTIDLAGAEEPGERLVLTGTVRQSDGQPAAGALIHAYHTDAEGDYGPGGAPASRLHGFVRADRRGRFILRTIRPGPYPQGGVPAHVHVEIAVGERVHVDECWFEGDPFLAESLRERERARGERSRILRLRRDGGLWRGEWQIALP